MKYPHFFDTTKQFQIKFGDFVKFCGHLRIHELYIDLTGNWPPPPIQHGRQAFQLELQILKEFEGK